MLRQDLASAKYRGDEIAIGTATNPYQVPEATYKLMRGALTALRDAQAPFHVTTRSPVIVRHLGLLAGVPRSASPSASRRSTKRSRARLSRPSRRGGSGCAPCALAGAGIWVRVAAAPVLPDVRQCRIAAAVVRAAADAGRLACSGTAR